MEIMLSHLGVGMAYDALDGLNIHAQRLHLRYISVTAAVGREQADIQRHRNIPDTVFGFRTADADRTF